MGAAKKKPFTEVKSFVKHYATFLSLDNQFNTLLIIFRTY